MTRDVRLAVLDVAVTIGFVALAILVDWWWVLFAVASGYIAYRQARLASSSASGPDTMRR